jgi:hypothetical protein
LIFILPKVDKKIIPMGISQEIWAADQVINNLPYTFQTETTFLFISKKKTSQSFLLHAK